uniref:Helicase ATP-binding domain-containing protein n=1 Tax=viral metagenome TaxID=1070528 RepID=A0A6C0EAM7_9ZZZZ
MKHPDVTENIFYKKINDIYKNFKIPKKKKTFNEICNPKEFQLQLPQEFLAEFMNPKTPYRGVLVYHRIGAGKTCTAVRIAEEWKKKRRVIVVVPASLKGNFRNELRSLCAGNSYLKESEREKLTKLHPSSKEYKEIIEVSDKRIDEYYEIYSYNKFIEYIQNDEIKLKNTLLIIDEIQNMVSEEGTYYYELYNLIKKSPKDLRMVLLSATPMFDKPNEIALTLNLLRPDLPLPTGRDFEKSYIVVKKKSDGSYSHHVKNIDDFKNRIRGYISYFRGAPPYVFPEMKVKYVKCEMSDFQYNAYKGVLKNEEKNADVSKLKKKAKKTLNVSQLPNNFFIGTRYVSNIVFPNKMINEEGFKSLTDKKIKSHLADISCKFNTIINKVTKTSGKIFIYSSFKEYAGLKSLIKILEAFGYKNYSKYGEGHKRFAVWTGDESINYKEEIKSVFNMKSNLNGSKLKIILGSSSIKEGVSFTGVRQVHILDPYWNYPRLAQVIGRASRFCSHKDLPEEKRNVKVYIYLAVHRNEEETIDEYIQNLSSKKNKLVMEFEKAIKESAIDCELNSHANMDNDNNYICDM